MLAQTAAEIAFSFSKLVRETRVTKHKNELKPRAAGAQYQALRLFKDLMHGLLLRPTNNSDNTM